MHEATHNSLTATASTPIATTTKSTTQQTGRASTGIPGWLSVDVPLLGALGIGVIIAAFIGVWGNMRLEKQRQRHGKELEDQRQHFEKERDEVRRQHEIALEQIKAEYENERQKQIGLKRLFDAWETLLNDTNLGIWELTEHSTYSDLENYFSSEFRDSVSPYIEYAIMRKLDMPQIGRSLLTENALYSSDEEFRGLLKQELSRLKKELGLI